MKRLTYQLTSNPVKESEAKTHRSEYLPLGSEDYALFSLFVHNNLSPILKDKILLEFAL